MNVDVLIISILVLLNIGQTYFWSRYVGQLIDKLMSRDYAEYVSVSKKAQTASSPVVQLPDPESVQEHDVLNEVNRMLGH